MATFQAYVYPLYDELKKLRGLNGVETHIKYVATHQNGTSNEKRNMAKYLRRAIEQYLKTVEIQRK